MKELLEPALGTEGFPLERFLLLPLDTTTPHEIPFPHYKERVDPEFDSTARPSDPTNKPPLVHFTSSFLERTREVMQLFGKDAMELHDIVAVWCAIENPPPSDAELAQAASTPILRKLWAGVHRKFQVERYVVMRVYVPLIHVNAHSYQGLERLLEECSLWTVERTKVLMTQAQTVLPYRQS